MKCVKHGAEAIGVCTVCGNAVCEDCAVPARKLCCQDCAQKATRQPRPRGEPAEEGTPAAGARRERPRRYERQRQSSGAKKTALLLVLPLLVGGVGLGMYHVFTREDDPRNARPRSEPWVKGEVRTKVTEELRGKIRAGNGAVEREARAMALAKRVIDAEYRRSCARFVGEPFTVKIGKARFGVPASELEMVTQDFADKVVDVPFVLRGPKGEARAHVYLLPTDEQGEGSLRVHSFTIE